MLNRLAELYRLKDGSVGEPDRYIGANIEKVKLDDFSVAWSITSREYITTAIHNLEDTLARDGAQTLKMFRKKAGRKAIYIELPSRIRRIPGKGRYVDESIFETDWSPQVGNRVSHNQYHGES